ncbi:MAG: nitroreductase family protein [Promethearchaeota archaeon]
MDSILTSRRSYKGPFARKPVEPSKVRAACDVARWAPSAHNGQPWRVVYLEPGPLREKLVDEMSAKYERDMLADGVPPGAAEVRVQRSRDTFNGVPALLVVFGDALVGDSYPDSARSEAEHDLMVSGVAAFTLQLLLAAEGEGLAGCWYCAPRFAPRIVRRVLSTPESWLPLAFVALGYPDPSTTWTGRPGRRDVGEFFFEGRLGGGEGGNDESLEDLK